MSQWIEDLRLCKFNSDILEFLKQRFIYYKGPALCTREDEAEADIIIELSNQDEDFRKRLDSTIADYLSNGDSNPNNKNSRILLDELFYLVGILHLKETGTWIPNWMVLNHEELISDQNAILGRAAFDGLATAQKENDENLLAFWLHYWHNGPKVWQWGAFIGLRLQNPKIAAEQLPELFKRLDEKGSDPRAMLFGFWKQVEGKLAIQNWLEENKHSEIAIRINDLIGFGIKNNYI